MSFHDNPSNIAILFPKTNYIDIMGNKNDKKERINVVYSTNPNYQYEYNQEEEQETLAPEKQNLRVTLDFSKETGTNSE